MEHLFWICFAVAGVIPVWVPLVIVTRSFAVDTVRGMALARGKTAFGSKTMMRTPVSRFLVSSRFMRTLYAVAKVAAFVLLGAVIAMDKGAGASRALELTALGVALVTVAVNLLRGLPVLWDSRTFLRHRASEADRKSTRLNSSHSQQSRMPSSA